MKNWGGVEVPYGDPPTAAGAVPIAMPIAVPTAPLPPDATGVKGSDVYSDEVVGNDLVALSTKLVRGTTDEQLVTLVEQILTRGSDAALRDFVVLVFQTRDVRGGKGERKLFQQLFSALYAKKPELGSALVSLIPEYGSWDDLFTIAAAALEKADWPILRAIYAHAQQQLENDEKTVADYLKLVANTPAEQPPARPSISLLAKWAPREGKQFGKLAVHFANHLASGGNYRSKMVHSQVMGAYRKRLAPLNRYLETVEVKECAKTWSKIDPTRVPARARELKKAAYLNEKVRKSERGPATPRHPGDKDREACREHFQAFFKAAAEGKVSISGAETLYPHEVVHKAMYADTEEDKNSLNPVWQAMVAKAAAGGGLGKSVFMCDFSSSMENPSGLPMAVSRAMGLLGCAVCAPPFKGRFLTFAEKPAWNVIDPDQPLTTQVQHFDERWGGTTDFQAAGEMILAELKKARAPAGTAPENLIVVTDMGFDAACGSSSYSAYSGASYRHNVKTAPKQTHAQMLREAFRRASEDVHGDPNAWPAPRIVIWNVVASYSDNHQAQADEEGVLTLSGWSPSLFKVICEEGPRAITPLEVLRLILDDKRYQPVRQRVDEWLAGGWRGL